VLKQGVEADDGQAPTAAANVQHYKMTMNGHPAVWRLLLLLLLLLLLIGAPSLYIYGWRPQASHSPCNLDDQGYPCRHGILHHKVHQAQHRADLKT
jgi:hypothetical protein